jgi:hypothetical protein
MKSIQQDMQENDDVQVPRICATCDSYDEDGYCKVWCIRRWDNDTCESWLESDKLTVLGSLCNMDVDIVAAVLAAGRFCVLRCRPNGLGVVPESCIKNCKECLEKWLNSYIGGF